VSAGELIADFLAELAPALVAPEALETARRTMLDTLAVAIAARHEPASLISLEYANGHIAPSMARVWSNGGLLPLELAAFINGVMGHVLDYDDVTSPMRGHPSVALWPALLAVGEARGVTLANLLTAYVAGFEVICRISHAVAADHYARGWHSTSTIGVIGAAAALAHMARLSREQCIGALGLAIAQSSGTRQNFGGMAKSFQAGHVGSAAVRALLLAERGFTAPAGTLDAFSTLYSDGRPLGEHFETLGTQPLEIQASGIEVKKYPMCYAAHRAIDGIIDLRTSNSDVELGAVQQITVTGSHGAFAPLIYDAPQSGLEAKFSLPYGIATALADGNVGFCSFNDAAVRRPEIQSFLPLVRKQEAEGGLFPRWVELDIHLRDGRRLHRRIDDLRGSAKLPLSDMELLDKARDCLTFGGAPPGSEQRLCHILRASLDQPGAALLDQCLPHVS